MFFLLLVPLVGFAQRELSAEEVQFYQDLATNDAIHEQSLPTIGPEDEKDFWKDQKAFETLLQANNPAAYRIYLGTKGKVYRQHQLGCGEAFCNHSATFIKQANYYIANDAKDSEMALVKKKKQRVSIE